MEQLKISALTLRCIYENKQPHDDQITDRKHHLEKNEGHFFVVGDEKADFDCLALDPEVLSSKIKKQQFKTKLEHCIISTYFRVSRSGVYFFTSSSSISPSCEEILSFA